MSASPRITVYTKSGRIAHRTTLRERFDCSQHMLRNRVIDVPSMKRSNFRAATLRSVHFRGVNLLGSDFRYARFDHVTFDHCNLFEADLRTSNLAGSNLIYASTELHGTMYGWQHTDGLLHVRAGCRVGTYATLSSRWSLRDDRRVALHALEYIKNVAKVRGWTVVV